MVELFYATYISVDIAYYEIFHAKVGKGGIKGETQSESVRFGQFWYPISYKKCLSLT